MIKQVSNLTNKFADCFSKHLQDTHTNEPAWKALTHSPGIDVWRINKFTLEPIPKDKHGYFYDGDSYVILHTYKNRGERVLYDAFIWIGNHSTPDEYGSAAYKMAELDVIVLNDAAIQHREVQGKESTKFLELFPTLRILKGGVDTGFREAKKGDYSPKLFHICGLKKNVQVTQVSYRKENVTDDDVFILDLGESLYQINGVTSNKEERFKGAQVLNELKSTKGKCTSEIIDNFSVASSHPVVDSMPVKNKSNSNKLVERETSFSLWKASDATGQLEISNIKNEKASRTDFKTDDVFIYDDNQCITVWVGKKTSKQEKMYAMVCAQKYAEAYNKTTLPFVKVSEGNESPEFFLCLA